MNLEELMANIDLGGVEPFSQKKIWILFMSSDDASNCLFIIKACSFQF